MKIQKFFFALLIFICVNSLVLSAKESKYTKPEEVSSLVWEDVKPYLMPMDHPLKKKMDKLFSSFRITESENSIIKAGFLRAKPAFFSKAIVSRHDNLKGYYFKFYSDEQEIDVESKQWIDRAFEAKSLKKTISDYGFKKYFVVPEKWIYVIPDHPKSNGPYPKHFVLVAKKIDILKGGENRYKWQKDIRPKILNALWTIIEKEGLIDSLSGHNLPFTLDGKLAFIDLEYHHIWPVPYGKLTQYLSPKMQVYWENLYRNNEP
jgi:hypothetical protein